MLVAWNFALYGSFDVLLMVDLFELRAKSMTVVHVTIFLLHKDSHVYDSVVSCLSNFINISGE